MNITLKSHIHKAAIPGVQPSLQQGAQTQIKKKKSPLSQEAPPARMIGIMTSVPGLNFT